MHIRKWNETRGAVVASPFPVSVSVAARTAAGLLAAALVLSLLPGAAVAQTDTTPPTLVKVKYNGAIVRLTFSEALDETVVPDRRHFRVLVWRSLLMRTKIENPAAVAISRRAVMLTLHGPVPERGDVYQAQYRWNPEVGGSKLRTLSATRWREHPSRTRSMSPTSTRPRLRGRR